MELIDQRASAILIECVPWVAVVILLAWALYASSLLSEYAQIVYAQAAAIKNYVGTIDSYAVKNCDTSKILAELEEKVDSLLLSTTQQQQHQTSQREPTTTIAVESNTADAPVVTIAALTPAVPEPIVSQTLPSSRVFKPVYPPVIVNRVSRCEACKCALSNFCDPWCCPRCKMGQFCGRSCQMAAGHAHAQQCIKIRPLPPFQIVEERVSEYVKKAMEYVPNVPKEQRSWWKFPMYDEMVRAAVLSQPDIWSRFIWKKSSERLIMGWKNKYVGTVRSEREYRFSRAIRIPVLTISLVGAR